MDPIRFQESPSGKIIHSLEGNDTFVPNPLPPDLTWDSSFATQISRADQAIAKLAGIGETLPNPHIFINPFIRREAVLSSRIEGTVTTLSELLKFEAGRGKAVGDVKEVINYVKALEFGLSRLKDIPMSLRLIRELHGILMEGVRGEHYHRGEFRRSQNWIGTPGCAIHEAKFVPPSVPDMKVALDSLEMFFHSDEDLPILVQAACIHYQFEAIHPFSDGNGRIGRLLITLFLCERGVLTKPLLYLSAFFEKHRQEYYDRLLRVSLKGTWREWIEFFLRAVEEQSDDAIRRARRLFDLQDTYRSIIQKARVAPSVDRLLEMVFVIPMVSAKLVAEKLSLSIAGAQIAIDRMVELNILQEITGKKRNRIYSAREIVRTLEGETVG